MTHAQVETTAAELVSEGMEVPEANYVAALVHYAESTEAVFYKLAEFGQAMNDFILTTRANEETYREANSALVKRVKFLEEMLLND